MGWDESQYIEEEIKMPWQLKHIEQLRPWQNEIINRSKYNNDTRTINILYDPTGGSGTSTLVLWCKVKQVLNRKVVPCILDDFVA